MSIAFYKYQGAGNDFVIIDNRLQTFPKGDFLLIARMCDRHFGIGADGLILLEESQEADFRMVYFNADGREGTMCGNGGRCIVSFANKLGLIKTKTSFLAIDGLHFAEVLDDGRVALAMNEVSAIEKITEGHYLLDTGSPHYVIVCDEMPGDFLEDARRIRNSERFNREGVNVNFIVIQEEKIHIRTYERGVENETLACGTGAVAAAAIARQLNTYDHFLVSALGGDLDVYFDGFQSFAGVVLGGPAECIFYGKW